MNHTSIKFPEPNIENLFKILSYKIETRKEAKVNKIVKEYDDGVTRTVTYSHRLRSCNRSGNKLTWTEHYYIMLSPSKEDVTHDEITTMHLDALSFMGYQIRDNVLLEIEYLDQWRELLDATLTDLRNLYGETNPAPQAAELPKPESISPSVDPKIEERQKEVLKLKQYGYSDKYIANKLAVSIKTVQRYKQALNILKSRKKGH